MNVTLLYAASFFASQGEMLPHESSPHYSAPYNYNTYGNIHGYVHDVSGIDITNDTLQYLGLDQNTMSFGGITQKGDALQTALHGAVAQHRPVSFFRWNLQDPQGQLGPLPQAVQQAAAHLRTAAFHALHEECQTTRCHYTQVGTLQAATTQLEDSLDALADAYHDGKRKVPPGLEDRLQQVHRMNARISTAHDEAAHLASTVETVTETHHMGPLISTLRDIGELTRNALPPGQEAALIGHASVEAHVQDKRTALQDVPSPSWACQVAPFMCHHWQRFDMSACQQKRHAQLAAGCAHQADCTVVSCALSGQFEIQQPDMKCVDPTTGEATGYTWDSKACPGHVQQLIS